MPIFLVLDPGRVMAFFLRVAAKPMTATAIEARKSSGLRRASISDNAMLFLDNVASG
jgi:hypothetical protein